jgi:hypothetical protein
LAGVSLGVHEKLPVSIPKDGDKDRQENKGDPRERNPNWIIRASPEELPAIEPLHPFGHQGDQPRVEPR